MYFLVLLCNIFPNTRCLFGRGICRECLFGWGFWVVEYAFVKVQIPGHKYNLKPSPVRYIYPISYKIAKKGKPPKMELPY